MNKYIVTAYVKRLGKRDTLSIPMTLAKATKYKKDREAEMKLAISKYKWARTFKIEKVKKK